MNRPIKFRAWDKERERMIIGAVLTIDFGMNRVWFDGETDTLDRLHLMQFTGLTDKNGKEIYEGDIIACYATDGHLVYNQEVQIPRIYEEIWGNQPDASCEVIGNIYENPNLLSV